MAKKSKKELAGSFLESLSSYWDPSAPCAFASASDGGRLTLGPLECIGVEQRWRFLMQGSDITQQVSDLLGLGLRSDSRLAGVNLKSLSGRVEAETMGWAIEQALREQPASEGAPSARFLLMMNALMPSAGSPFSEARTEQDGRKLGAMARELSAATDRWSWDHRPFERVAMELGFGFALGFFSETKAAGPGALMDFASVCKTRPGWVKVPEAIALAGALMDAGCAPEGKSAGALGILEAAGLGEVVSYIEARSLGASVARPEPVAQARRAL